ncbi:uncharacterized protein Z518_00092 [Rhinocladiella mackenziei CBS 650.93]|uniref:Capsule polysaccharide biosynthesis protein n=1 Tax=Rhinocladiella mackenziei CBS 650.93 TaxID=1442369 RepID=A0A0D2IST7_9EURO|nr:uncharacterized protein Z518_00092 [Rhinocladiella mackenziei CBS 650.93]KIX09014.1 hypothetical protein Z518_00092 [Rhinocladiella mackenziei CBS 650.93]
MPDLTSPPASGSEFITLFANYTSTPLLESDSLVSAWVGFCQLISWDNAWKLSTLTLLLLNLKVFPFVYHLRLLNGLRFVLRSQRPKRDVGPEQLFQPLITSSKSCLMELDVFGHKSNSTYFADVDIARVHLVTTMFGKGIDKIRGGTTMNGLSGKPHSKFTVALGAVSCTFKKEILPYEGYDMWTRVLSWDEKWVYLVTHFVKKGFKMGPKMSSLYPHQDKQAPKYEVDDNGDTSMFKTETTDSTCGPAKAPIAASALSKIVFKNGRITISPQQILEASNLLPIASLGDAETKAEKSFTNMKLSAAIEAERQRGLHLAALLAGQTALEDEFYSEIALGRHYDGLGIEGIVTTLAQLGKVSSYQLI